MSLHRVIIIDDEYLARCAIEDKLIETGLFEITGSFDSVAKAQKFLRTQNRLLDFIFCDIEMPDVTGLEAATLLKQYCFYFVCCTGHQKYTSEAWKHLVDAFLVKPIVDDLLLALVDKYRRMMRNAGKPKLDYLMMDQLPENNRQEMGKRVRSFIKIMIDDVCYFRKSGNYLYAYGQNEKGLLVKIARTASTVKDFKEKYWFLENLICINQSEIVNMDYVKHYENEKLTVGNEILVVYNLGKKNVASFFAKHDPNY